MLLSQSGGLKRETVSIETGLKQYKIKQLHKRAIDKLSIGI